MRLYKPAGRANFARVRFYSDTLSNAKPDIRLFLVGRPVPFFLKSWLCSAEARNQYMDMKCVDMGGQLFLNMQT